MSRQNTCSPHERNIYIKYHNVPSGEPKIRSGIIERHTYKTDNGKLLSSTPVDSYKVENLHGNTLRMSRTTIIKTNTNQNQNTTLSSPTKHHTIHQNVNPVKMGHHQEENKVKTVHCDSTTNDVEAETDYTNIINWFSKKFDDFEQQNSTKTVSNQSTSNYKVLNWLSNKYDVLEAQNSTKLLMNKQQSPNTKVLNWFQNKYDESNIQMISDSEDDHKTHKSEELTSSQRISPQNSNIASDKHSLALLNAKYHSIVTQLNPKHTDSSKMCSTPKNKLSRTVLEAPPSKDQKIYVQLSPESMKSEFYSYLKINTNPSIQKTENVSQNRRSTRVKKLILQNEKNRDKKIVNKQIKDKNNDVRKKFLKYSRFRIAFPPPPIRENKISDFGQTIALYFVKENINCDDLIEKAKMIKTIKTNGDSLGQNEKYIKKNIVLKGLRDKKRVPPFFRDKKLLRFRFRSSRILRSNPIIRTTLDGFKMRKKMRKTKLKAKMRQKNCQNDSEITKSNENTESIELSSGDSKSDKDDQVNCDSPPFLGFNQEENSNKISEDIQQLVSELDSLTKEVPNTNLVDEVEDIISISSTEENEDQIDLKITEQEVVDVNLLNNDCPNYIPLNQNIKTKSFHKSLMRYSLKSAAETPKTNVFELSDSDSSMSNLKIIKGPHYKRSQTHDIDINKNNGAIFNTYYVNDILIIVQEQLISFWKQTALGKILGVQNMWLPYGSVQRIILDPGCVNRRSPEMILSFDSSVAYIELWTKEHKCVYRECPVADVFATIYFHKGIGLPDKKVLQLENIKGHGDDVRFAVVKNSREIMVSWCDRTKTQPIKTLIRCYQLASDFQTVCSIKEIENVSHYIASLHNIHDCDDLVLGAGNEQISLWNLRHGYLVTTLSLFDPSVDIIPDNRTICLYAQCDTGFLFIIQQTKGGILRLIAVNGKTQDWKLLHSYQVPESYKELLGVAIESGVLMNCYTNGLLCWNMHSGDVLAEIITPNEFIVLPSNKHLISIDNYKVTVEHIMSYILTRDW